MNSTTHPFIPDWISPPGETIAELLEEWGWTVSQLARRLNYTEEQVQQLIDGDTELSAETAHKLVEIFGIDEYFWLNLEGIYRSQLAKTLV